MSCAHSHTPDHVRNGSSVAKSIGAPLLPSCSGFHGAMPEGWNTRKHERAVLAARHHAARRFPSRGSDPAAQAQLGRGGGALKHAPGTCYKLTQAGGARP